MKISTSNIVKGFCAILLLGIIAVSCRKDPIFFIISNETAPIPPRIAGAPTNMVRFDRKNPYNPSAPDIPLLFVASGRLHWYGSPNPAIESPRWDRNYGIPQPGGTIISLAVTKDYLYALCLNGSSLHAKLRYIGHGDVMWQTVIMASDYPLIQSIYSTYSDGDTDPGRLFAGARKNNTSTETYAILYLESAILRVLIPNTEMLSGAAYRDNNYYVCTRGDGIFKISDTDLTVSRLRNIQSFGTSVPGPPPADPDDPPPPNEVKQLIQDGNNKIFFMGMIKLGIAESIIAIERDGGTLYEILTDTDINNMFPNPLNPPSIPILERNGAFSQIFYIDSSRARTSGYAIGALALWEDPLNPDMKLLVASKQGTLLSSSYNNGYSEFKLKPDGSFDKVNPSSGMLTVNNPDRYSTSLEKQPINHLFQAPEDVDPKKTFFASTQTGGLWSYRDRSSNGGWQWNAEN